MTKNNSILFTNLSLCARTGSELHVTELAMQFKKNGWDVSCFTLVKGYPLQEHLENQGIKIITAFENEDELESSYDVLFAQHKCVSEYLINSHNISFNVVALSILGLASVTEHESLPYYKNEADLLFFISEEAKTSCNLSNEFKSKSFIFPNYATKEYFFENNRSFPQTPQKIAVISNHIPKEIYEFKELMRGVPVSVELFGYETKSIELSPEILHQYDLVISIGKTAQNCFASKTPFYCYDHFGGPGFISLETIATHEKQNFSGRSCPTKRSAQELKDDIMDNYQNAVKEIDRIHAYALQNYSFTSHCQTLEKNIELLLSKKNYRTLSRAKDTYALTKSINTCHEFVREYQAHLGTGEIFFQKEAKECSFRFRYRYNNRIAINKQTNTKLGPDSIITRFDPDIVPCTCKLESDGTALNADQENQGMYTFLTRDPIYLVPNTDTIIFSAKAFPDSLEALENKIDRLNSELQETKTIRKTAKQLGRLLRNKI